MSVSNRTFGSVIKVYRPIYSRYISKPSGTLNHTPAANFTSSKCVMLQLNIASGHILKATLSIFPTQRKKSGRCKFKENPYLGFPLGLDSDGGVRNRIFSIHLQTEVSVIPVPA